MKKTYVSAISILMAIVLLIIPVADVPAISEESPEAFQNEIGEDTAELSDHGIVTADQEHALSTLTGEEIIEDAAEEAVDEIVSEDEESGIADVSDDSISDEGYAGNEIDAPIVIPSEEEIVYDAAETVECVGAGGASWESAAGINIGQKYTDNLQNGDKYYRFSISKPGAINVEFEHQYDESAHWEVMVYNTNDAEDYLVAWDFDGSGTVMVKSESLGIPSGSYILKMKRPYSYSNKDYSFKILYTESPLWERERNDTPVTATYIQTNEIYHGGLQDSWDKDYYCFETSAPGYITMSFTHTYDESSYSYWKLELYNYSDMDNYLYQFETKGNATSTEISPYIGLPSGKYILKIYGNYYYILTDYGISIDYTQSDHWEKESNNTAVNATRIGTNVSVFGSTLDSYDDDYYLFSLEKSDRVSISFSHGKMLSSSTFWRMRLYNYNDLNKSIQCVDYRGNTTKVITSSQVNLRAGTYLVKIESIYHLSDIKYTLKVNSKGNLVHVNSISLNTDSLTLAIGESAQLNAAVTPENASDKSVTWKAFNTRIAEVDESGKVYGVADGTTTITATTVDGKKTASARIIVGTGEVRTDSRLLAVGQKYSLKNHFVGEKIAKYIVSKKGIVSISKGVLKAKKKGAVEITACIKIGKKYEPIGKIVFTIEKPVFSQKLKATRKDQTLEASDYLIDLNGLEVSGWKSSKPSVASIDMTTGTITALKNGTTTVSASFGEGSYSGKATVKLTVKIPYMSLKTKSMNTGSKTTLKLKNTSLEPVWSVSDNSIVLVDQEGRVTALSAGIASVCATVEDVTYECAVTVKPPKMKQSVINLKVGKTTKITWENTSLKSFEWHINDPSVVAVESNGKIKALSPGQTIISTTTGGALNQCIVIVTKSGAKAKKIPKGAVEYDSRFYYIYKSSTKWSEAKKKCESLGGHLVTITSAEEQEFIESINTKYLNLWTGGSKKADEWQWVTDEGWSYSKWGEGKPDNSGRVVPNEDHIVIMNDGYWDDLANGNVYEQSGYICEWEQE